MKNSAKRNSYGEETFGRGRRGREPEGTGYAPSPAQLNFTPSFPSDQWLAHLRRLRNVYRHFSNDNLSPDLTWNHVLEEGSHFLPRKKLIL